MGVMEWSNYDENNLALKGISASFAAKISRASWNFCEIAYTF